MDGNRYGNDNLLDLWWHTSNKGALMIILVTEERVAYIQRHRTMWEIGMHHLKLVEVRGKFIVFHIADDNFVGEKAIELDSAEVANDLQKRLSVIISQ